MPYSDIRVFYFRVLYCTIVGMTNWFIGELFWSRMSESIQARRDIRVALWLRRWYKILYQGLPVVLTNRITTLATRSDIGSHNRFDLIQSLVPPYYVCNTNLYNTTFCAWRHVICYNSFFCFASVAYIDVFSSHSNDMTSWQNSSAEKIASMVTLFFYYHSVVIEHQEWIVTNNVTSCTKCSIVQIC
jgi:hypothetical protein